MVLPTAARLNHLLKERSIARHVFWIGGTSRHSVERGEHGCSQYGTGAEAAAAWHRAEECDGQSTAGTFKVRAQICFGVARHKSAEYQRCARQRIPHGGIMVIKKFASASIPTGSPGINGVHCDFWCISDAHHDLQGKRASERDCCVHHAAAVLNA